MIYAEYSIENDKEAILQLAEKVIANSETKQEWLYCENGDKDEQDGFYVMKSEDRYRHGIRLTEYNSNQEFLDFLKILVGKYGEPNYCYEEEYEMNSEDYVIPLQKAWCIREDLLLFLVQRYPGICLTTCNMNQAYTPYKNQFNTKEKLQELALKLLNRETDDALIKSEFITNVYGHTYKQGSYALLASRYYYEWDYTPQVSAIEKEDFNYFDSLKEKVKGWLIELFETPSKEEIVSIGSGYSYWQWIIDNKILTLYAHKEWGDGDLEINLVLFSNDFGDNPLTKE